MLFPESPGPSNNTFQRTAPFFKLDSSFSEDDGPLFEPDKQPQHDPIVKGDRAADSLTVLTYSNKKLKSYLDVYTAESRLVHFSVYHEYYHIQ